MSLSVGVLTILHEDGGETELEARGKIFRIGSLMSCDLILNEAEAKRIHCEIASDTFGRITVTNFSKRNPVLLDGNPLSGTRPLFTGSVIQIFDKKLRWINKNRHPRNEMITPKNDRTQRLNKQAPYSASDASRKVKLSKRNTMHSFGQRIDDTLDGDLDRTTDAAMWDRQSRMSMSAALKTAGATPPRCIKTPSKEKTRRSMIFEPAARFDSDDKENSQQVLDDKISILLKCQPSAMLVTSFSPSTTPAKTPMKSFALVTANKSTPKSVYSTPRSILSDLNNEGEMGAASTPPKTPPANVYLIDFTTPDVYKTPLQKRTPLIRSVLKNSVTKSTAKTVTRSPLPVKQSNSPVSTKKIRFESPTSTKKAVLAKTPAKIETSKTYSTPNRANLSKSSATKKPLNISGFAATTTPTSLTKHKNSPQIMGKIGSAAKTTPLALKRKSSNCSISSPLKTPKTIFAESVESKNATPTKIPVVCRSSSARTSTHQSTTPVGIGNRSVNKNATLERSVTFIMDSPQNTNNIEQEDQEVDSKSDSTFTFEDSIEIPETQDQPAEVADIDSNKSIDSFAESRRSVSKRFSLLSTTHSVSFIDIEPTPEDTMNEDIKAEEKRQSAGKLSRRQSEIDVAANSDRNESVKEELSPGENPLNQTFDKDEHGDAETPMKKPDCMETPKRKSLRSLESTNLDAMYSEDENPAEDAETQQTRRVTSRKSLKSPKLFGVRELLKSPESPIEANFVGLKELVQSPRNNLGLSDLRGVKEMYNTPVKDELDNMVGVKELVKTPKTQQGLNDVRGLKEMYNTPYRDDLTDVFGVKELVNTPKFNSGLENPRGLRELYKTPIRDDLTDVRGVKELLKTPNLKSPQLKGVREMLKTPQLKSPELKGICEMYKTPKLSTYEDAEGIHDIFKTPSSRSIMILNTPKSVVIEKRASLVADLMKTPEQVDLHDDLDKMDSLFKTPLSEIAEYSEIEKNPANEENLTTDETFDKLIGKPIIRRTYERSPVKQLMLAVPIQEAANDDNVKTDIQEWVENIDTSLQGTDEMIKETVKDSIASENSETASPSIDSNRKPLAASSSIKPTAEVRRSTRRRQFSIDEDLNEMSGIEKLNESACSTNQTCIGCDGRSGVGTTPRTPRKSVTTPRKSVGTPTRASSARRALKATPQIRRLLGQSTRKTGGNSSAKGLFDELSVQFIDETTIAEVDSSMAAVNEKSDSVAGNVGSTIRSITLNEYEPSEPNDDDDDDLELISVVDSIDESSRRIPRKTQSGGVISISDEDESETDVDKANKIEETVPKNTTVEFVALNELSVFSEPNIGTPVSDVFKINRSRIQEMDTINESQNELETPDHSILTAGNMTTPNIHQEQAVAEEALLEQYELEASKEDDKTCQTMEAVYLDEQLESSCLEKSSKNNKRATIGCDSSVEFNECNDTLWRSVAGQQSSTDPIDVDDDDDEFANFETVPRVRETRLSQPEALLKSVKILINRRTVGQPSLTKTFDVETERKRHELSMELKDFQSDEPQSQRPAKRGTRLSQPEASLKSSKILSNRRTVGQPSLSKSFDLETERKCHELSMELKDFESDEPQSQRPAKRGARLSQPEASLKSGKILSNRRTVGQPSLTKTFDLETERKRHELSMELKDFQFDEPQSQRPAKRGTRLSQPEASLKSGKILSNRRTVGQPSLSKSFDLETERKRHELSMELKDFESDEPQSQRPAKRGARFSQPEASLKSGKILSNRRTVGQPSLSKSFDLETERKRHELSMELKDFESDEPQSQRPAKRGRTLTPPAKTISSAKDSLTRRTMGDKTSTAFDVEKAKARFLKAHTVWSQTLEIENDDDASETEFNKITYQQQMPFEAASLTEERELQSNVSLHQETKQSSEKLTSSNTKIEDSSGMSNCMNPTGTETAVISIEEDEKEDQEMSFEVALGTEDQQLQLNISSDNENPKQSPEKRVSVNTKITDSPGKENTMSPAVAEAAVTSIEGDESLEIKKRRVLIEDNLLERESSLNDSRHVHFGENEYFNITKHEIQPVEEATDKKRGRKIVTAGRTPAKGKGRTAATSRSRKVDNKEKIQQEENTESVERKDTEDKPIVEGSAEKPSRRARKASTTDSLKIVEFAEGNVKGLDKEIQMKVPSAEVPKKRGGRHDKKSALTETLVSSHSDETELNIPQSNIALEALPNTTSSRRGRKQIEQKTEVTAAECESNEESPREALQAKEAPTVKNNRRGRKVKEPVKELKEELSAEPVHEPAVVENPKTNRRGRRVKEPVKELKEEPEEVSVEPEEVSVEPEEVSVEPAQETLVVENAKTNRRGKKAKEPVKKSNEESQEVAQEIPVVENSKTNRRGRKVKELDEEPKDVTVKPAQETPIIENVKTNRRGEKAKEPVKEINQEPKEVSIEPAQETPVVENPNNNRRGQKAKESSKELKEKLDEVSVEPALETPLGPNTKGSRQGRKAKEPVQQLIAEPEEVSVEKVQESQNTKSSRRGRKAQEPAKASNQEADEMMVEPMQESHVLENTKGSRRGMKDKEPIKQSIEKPVSENIESTQETSEVENAKNNRRGRKAKEAVKDSNQEPEETVVESLQETPIVENATSNRRGRRAKEPVRQLVEKPESDNTESAQETPVVGNAKNNRRGKKTKEAAKESNQESEEMVVEPLQEIPIAENATSNRRGKKVKEPVGQFIEKPESDNTESAQETPVVGNAKNNRRGKKTKEAAKESNQESEEMVVEPLQETPIVENATSNRRGKKVKEPVVKLIEKPESDNTESAQETPVAGNAKNSRRGKKTKEAVKESNQELEEMVMEPLQETPIVENAKSNRRGKTAKEPVVQLIEKPDSDNTESAQETPVMENAKNNRRRREANEPVKELNKESQEVRVEPAQETPLLGNAKNNRRGRKAPNANVPTEEQSTSKPEEITPISATGIPDTTLTSTKSRGRRGKHANSEEATKITQPPSTESLTVQSIEEHEIPPTKRTKILQQTVVEASPLRRGRSARNIEPIPEVSKPSRKRRI